MSLLDRRVRGFRLVDLVAAGLLVVLVFGVYLAKTMAGRERVEIARVERQIREEKARIRLLQAEVAHLEEPARLEHLSVAYLGLAPVSIKRDVNADGLADIARTAANTGRLPDHGMPAAPHAPLGIDPTRPVPEPAPKPEADAE
ncbi:cell division protein [Phenylobacterium sp. LjRoot219]|uniref:cell division protein FtsL n=1 Tax=Phenylobacterium sp. LjRoot219 TaxID=3342283 RepID=UPI003ECCD13A